jgi:hypothetical protein
LAISSPLLAANPACRANVNPFRGSSTTRTPLKPIATWSVRSLLALLTTMISTASPSSPVCANIDSRHAGR